MKTSTWLLIPLLLCACPLWAAEEVGTTKDLLEPNGAGVLKRFQPQEETRVRSAWS